MKETNRILKCDIDPLCRLYDKLSKVRVCNTYFSKYVPANLHKSYVLGSACFILGEGCGIGYYRYGLCKATVRLEDLQNVSRDELVDSMFLLNRTRIKHSFKHNKGEEHVLFSPGLIIDYDTDDILMVLCVESDKVSIENDRIHFPTMGNSDTRLDPRYCRLYISSNMVIEDKFSRLYDYLVKNCIKDMLAMGVDIVVRDPKVIDKEVYNSGSIPYSSIEDLENYKSGILDCVDFDFNGIQQEG